ncbi:MAG: hypothetical protein ACWA5A_17580, partial [Marinibacterium sp.]
ENGSLTFKVENRHAYGDVAPQFFGFDSGALSITGTAFNDIGTALTNLFWTQRAADGTCTTHFLLAAVYCDYLSGTPRPADDVTDAAWIPLPDVFTGRLDMSDKVADVVRLAQSRLGRPR